jgi:hypothetical protein
MAEALQTQSVDDVEVAHGNRSKSAKHRIAIAATLHASLSSRYNFVKHNDAKFTAAWSPTREGKNLVYTHMSDCNMTDAVIERCLYSR